MSSLVFETAQRLVDHQSYYHRSEGIGAVAILLLIALLVAAEVLRALDGRWKDAAQRTLVIAVEPLLFAFVVVVGVRLVLLF
jgi:hypothetical protein